MHPALNNRAISSSNAMRESTVQDVSIRQNPSDAKNAQDDSDKGYAKQEWPHLSYQTPVSENPMSEIQVPPTAALDMAGHRL